MDVDYCLRRNHLRTKVYKEMRSSFPTSSKASARLRSVGSKDTRPELTLRRIIHSWGYRYRLHVSWLPGRPDLVFATRRKVIFVHGCFWHRHSCRRGRSTPTTNALAWRRKFDATVVRDKQNLKRLSEMGWKSLCVWECQLAKWSLGRLEHRIRHFLDDK